MKENKNRWQQLAIFSGICMALLLVFNVFIVPSIKESQVRETNYSYFMKKVDEGKVKKVQIEESVIKFETEDDTVKKHVY